MFFYNQNNNNYCNSNVLEQEPLFPIVEKVQSWKAAVSKFPEVELFLESVKNDLLNPTSLSTIHDNLK